MIFLLTSVLRLLLRGSRSVVLENAALRHQLAVLQRSAGRPKLRPKDRWFWASLSKSWSEWKDALVLVHSADWLGCSAGSAFESAKTEFSVTTGKFSDWSPSTRNSLLDFLGEDGSAHER